MTRRPWYKRDGAAFISGTMGLTLEEKGAYSLCLDLIYSEGGPIPDDARWLAGICGVSLRKWTAIRDRLIAVGKLFVEGGRLMNNRAIREIAAVDLVPRKPVETGGEGDGHNAETEGKPSRNSRETPAKSPRNQAETPAKSQRKQAENEVGSNNINDLVGGDIDKERDREGDIEGEKKESRPAGADHPSTGGGQFDLLPTPSPEPDLCEQALEAFNRTVDFVNQNHSAEWRPCRMLTDKRRQHLTKRLKECHGLVGWIEAMRKAVASKYLLGKTARPAEYADWRPNIDFFLQPSSFAKLLEGHYDDRIRQGSAIDRATARAARNFASSGIDPGGPDFRFEAPDVADRAA